VVTGKTDANGIEVFEVEVSSENANIDGPSVLLLVFDKRCEETEPEVEVEGCLGGLNLYLFEQLSIKAKVKTCLESCVLCVL